MKKQQEEMSQISFKVDDISVIIDSSESGSTKDRDIELLTEYIYLIGDVMLDAKQDIAK